MMFWVVISGVMSRVTIVITHIRVVGLPWLSTVQERSGIWGCCFRDPHLEILTVTDRSSHPTSKGGLN